jgi:BirA family transcriptional regulator, biotin operon repressor / biotin---[acetyl-CoA-carboxylase] ligase
MKTPDLLLPEVIAPLVRDTIFGAAGNIRHFFRVGSTNMVGIQAAESGAPEGTLFLAEEQTAGRGRGGHTWHSEPSTGIYVSAILRPKLSSGDLLALSLMTGLATANAVEEVTGVRCELRWPNDLLIGPRKFCGILTEVHSEAKRLLFAVVGIGMNVNQDVFPAELQEIATSLRLETGREWSRVELTAALLQSLDREYHSLSQGGSKDVFQRFERRSSYARGLEVHVEESGGYTGVTEGLDESGFLRVRTEDGVRTVISGGVRALSK